MHHWCQPIENDKTDIFDSFFNYKFLCVKIVAGSMYLHKICWEHVFIENKNKNSANCFCLSGK